jgi:membrane-bound lytic murein transglycosylase A
LVMAQDTGSAIQGPHRADFFFGSGAAAGELAGRMKSQGQLIVLLPQALDASTLERLFKGGRR